MPNSRHETLEPLLPLPENQFAMASVLAPGALEADRPVFVHGPAGAGKTLLMRHAASHIRAARPKARIWHLSGSEFAARFAESASLATIAKFQAETRHLDALLLEDLQALEGRPETQTQLLWLIDTLRPCGRRLMWSSRKSPGELTSFLPKLVSRFRAGVLAPIRMPGVESRRLLLDHFARRQGLSLPADACRLLSQKLPVSPRELNAVVQQLRALSRGEKQGVDSDLVRRFLAHDVPPPPCRLDDVCRAVARQFGVTAAGLRSKKRHSTLVRARQCAMALARELTPCSLMQIGRYFSGRDHSTVVHACQRLAELVERDPQLLAAINQARRTLGAGLPDQCE
ncbi:MAG: DnaA/Hda family protein [Planctomycetaceae bacterium]